MPAESVASLMCYADLKTNGVTPSGYGMLRIFKYNNNYAACEFSCSDTADSWSGYINTGSGAGIYWSGWQKVLFINGGTLTGALNFANNTWNKIGDDVQIGDANVAGTLCI